MGERFSENWAACGESDDAGPRGSQQQTALPLPGLKLRGEGAVPGTRTGAGAMDRARGRTGTCVRSRDSGSPDSPEGARGIDTGRHSPPSLSSPFGLPIGQTSCRCAPAGQRRRVGRGSEGTENLPHSSAAQRQISSFEISFSFSLCPNLLKA